MSRGRSSMRRSLSRRVSPRPRSLRSKEGRISDDWTASRTSSRKRTRTRGDVEARLGEFPEPERHPNAEGRGHPRFSTTRTTSSSMGRRLQSDIDGDLTRSRGRPGASWRGSTPTTCRKRAMLRFVTRLKAAVATVIRSWIRPKVDRFSTRFEYRVLMSMSLGSDVVEATGLQKALETEGVVFLPEDGGLAGVRLRREPPGEHQNETPKGGLSTDAVRHVAAARPQETSVGCPRAAAAMTVLDRKDLGSALCSAR